MSIKNRLKRIEDKLPEVKAAAAVSPGVEDLLFMDYEEFRKTFVEWIMAVYMKETEKAEKFSSEVRYLINSLEPITKKSQFDEEAFQNLFVVKLVDWMEENGLKDIDFDRWEELNNELEIQAEQAGARQKNKGEESKTGMVKPHEET